MEKVIYQIRNKVNGKLYIGSSINPKRRWKEHKRTLKIKKSPSSILQKAWNKYGEVNFEFEILEYVKDDLDMIWVEEEYIILFDTINNGYNIYLPYTEQKMNYSKFKNMGSKTKDWFLTHAPNGLKQISSEEWIKRRNEDITYKLPTKKDKSEWKIRVQSNSIPIIGVDNNGNIIKSYKSIYEAVGGNQSKLVSFSKCTKQNSNYTKLYKRYSLYWYKKEDFNKERFLKLVQSKTKIKNVKPYSERSLKRIPTSIQNIDSKEVLSFNSILECANYLNCSYTKICALKKGYQNKGGGRISKVNSIKGYQFLSVVDSN